MSTSILATMCAERLTKILVRYSRAPQPTVVRSQSQCPVRSVNPLPQSEATVAYLKPSAAVGAPKWQPSLASFSSIGQRLQQATRDELPLLRAQTEPQPLSSAQKSWGFQDWKQQLATTRYSAPFASLFQGQRVPMKTFSQVSRADKVYRDCY